MRLTLVLPALNEEIVLRPNAERVADFCASALSDWETAVVIVDNKSIDRTGEIGRVLAMERGNIRYLRLEKQGKGLAIRSGWQAYPADVYAFMDADLATDIASFPELVRVALKSGGVAVGSRFHRDSKVERSFWRSSLSWGYSIFHRLALATKVVDLPCGFKAAAAPVVASVLPQTRDNGWFFDSEFVVRAERAGFAVREVPVVWREAPVPNRQSKVSVWRLVPEYCRRVMALRRELSSRNTMGESVPPSRIRTESSSNDGVVSSEWRAVAWLSVVAMAVTSVPPLVGLYVAHVNGWVWKGLSIFAPGDFGVYLSYINQARHGDWLLKSLVTLEPITPSFNILWWSVGQLARLVGSPLLAFHVARILTIILLAVVAWRFIRHFFAESRWRLGALALFLFGSGFGAYYALLFPLPTAPSYGTRMEMPVDLWMAESNAFLSMLYSPHFVASLALLLLAFLCLLNAWRKDDWRWAVGGGLSSLVLISFHPFNAPTLYFVPAVWLLLQAALRRLRWKQAVAYAIFVAVSLPALAYQAYMSLFAPYGWQMTSGNLCLSPAPWHYALGFGAVVFLAPFGWHMARGQAGKRGGSATRPEWDFLAVWAAAQFLLLYFPFTFQRRLVEGLQFPLTLLAVPAIIAFLAWCQRRRFARSGGLAFSAIAVALIFLPSSSLAIVRNIIAYQDDQPPIFYMSQAEADAFRWVSENVPRDAAFMAKADSGNSIVGWSGHRVFVGHWANTIDFDGKTRQAEAFFLKSTRGSRWQRARELGITHVWCGPIEHMSGGECPEGESGFRMIYNKGGYAVFGVEPSK